MLLPLDGGCYRSFNSLPRQSTLSGPPEGGGSEGQTRPIYALAVRNADGTGVWKHDEGNDLEAEIVTEADAVADAVSEVVEEAVQEPVQTAMEDARFDFKANLYTLVAVIAAMEYVGLVFWR